MCGVLYKVQYQTVPQISWVQNSLRSCARIPTERSVRYLANQDTHLTNPVVGCITQAITMASINPEDVRLTAEQGRRVSYDVFPLTGSAQNMSSFELTRYLARYIKSTKRLEP